MNLSTIQIAQQIQQNGFAGTSQGLMYGNIGYCLFYYKLARETHNSEYEILADDLLDKVFANLSSSALPDLENGLSGIGWGIEYLVQNGFAEGDTDEILEEVDNKVFKVLNEENINSFELGNGLTGYLFYLISRLKKPANTNPMAWRINRELLILTINKLDEVVTAQFASVTKDMSFDLFWRFPVMLYGLVQAFNLNIYSEKIRCMVNQWMMNLETYLPSMHINRLYMATVLSVINEIIPDKRLEKQVQILLYATDFEILKTEVDRQVLNIRYGWPGVLWLLNIASNKLPADCPNYRLISETYREISKSNNNWEDNLLLSFAEENRGQLGIALGPVGIGLLDLLYPGIMPCSPTNTDLLDKPTVTCILHCGLGNQLFQISAAYSLAIDNNAEFVVDLGKHRAPPQGNKAISYRNNLYRSIKTGPTKVSSLYRERSFEYNPIPYSPNLAITGYFQSEKYFRHNRAFILELFKISDEDSFYLYNKYSGVLSQNTCSLHIRRGDYLKWSDEFPACSEDYYRKGQMMMPDGTTFLIFSDDITWCKENFKGENYIYIEEKSDYLELCLMSLCRNNIIANSSFSWWGAWLNTNPDKIVVAPKLWFGKGVNHNTSDLIPEEWIQV